MSKHAKQITHKMNWSKFVLLSKAKPEYQQQLRKKRANGSCVHPIWGLRKILSFDVQRWSVLAGLVRCFPPAQGACWQMLNGAHKATFVVLS